MSSVRPTTERLVAARPPIVDSLDELVGADERAQLLEQILASPVRHGGRSRPRGVVMATTVAAVAAALVAATIFATRVWPGEHSTGGRPTVSPVLLAHMTLAVRSAHDVAVIDSTNDGVRSTFWTLTQGGGATRMRYSVDGRPSYDQTISSMHGRRTLTNVDFAARAWWTEVLAPVPGNPCAVTVVRRGSTAPRATSAARPRHSASSCQVFGPTPGQVVHSIDAGVFHITGHPVLHGRRTIELTSQYPGTTGTYTLYVDAKSYLPVMSINSVNSPPFTTTYRYLPATRANMALLQVPIPEGFRHAEQPIRCNPSQLGPHESTDGCP